MSRTDLADTRAFFGPRAAGWETRFPGDEPRYERAIAELGLETGAVVLDAACGTGRAIPALRAAVGPGGRVLALDVTAEMLTEAARLGRNTLGVLLLGDVNRLPLAAGSVDAVFAAGLISHLADPVAGLTELARVCRPGGRLAIFHPIGRAALARRHGHELEEDDIRGGSRIGEALARAGWRADSIDDAEDRYLVLASRA